MNNRFLALIVLLGMISYSGYAFHGAFVEAKGDAATAIGLGILLHVFAGCFMVGLYLVDTTSDK